MSYLLDFATCPYCKIATPIRPSKPAIPEDDPQWSGEDGTDLTTACSECKRLYRLPTLKLRSLPSPVGIAPFHHDAPIMQFHVGLECDNGLGCEAPIRVTLVRTIGTTEADVKAEMAEWKGRDLRCENGHEQDYPSGWE